MELFSLLSKKEVITHIDRFKQIRCLPMNCRVKKNLDAGFSPRKLFFILLASSCAGATGFFLYTSSAILPTIKPLDLAVAPESPGASPSNSIPNQKQKVYAKAPAPASVPFVRSLPNLATKTRSEGDDSTSPPSSPNQPPGTKPSKNIFLWIGAGAMYVNYEQTDNQNLATASFSKIMAPSCSVGAEADLNDFLKLHLRYHQAVGTIPAQEDASAQGKEYKQVTLKTAAEWVLNRTMPTTFSILLGFQTQDLSFFVVDENGALAVLDNNLQQISLGGKLQHQGAEGISYLWSLHYNHLLSSSGGGYDFRASSAQIFDTEFGINKRTSNGIVAGLYWSAQYIRFNYDWRGNGLDTRGSQSFFTPSLELRLGYEF